MTTFTPKSTPKPKMQTTLTAYSGIFGYAEAAHLLRRTTMGATHADIQQAVTDGLAATVANLMTVHALPAPPLNHENAADLNAPIGTTWYGQNLTSFDDFSARRRSFRAWQMLVARNEEAVSIREKMTLFWHNHFTIESGVVNNPSFLYQYMDLLRTHFKGDFKQLVKEVTINPAMLRYLDGRLNTETSPNENFAREILELFTIGKGEQIGPGDYTHYSESDIIELAKVFTGWRDQGYWTLTIPTPYSEFVASKHDDTDKTLSYHFGNAVILENGIAEYKDAIDVIFLQDEVAYNLCRKLYRYFVNYDITPTIETSVIDPLAQCLITNNYVVEPVLEELFKSQHFYDLSYRGSIIKHPIEFVLSALRTFEIPSPTTLFEEYDVFKSLHYFMAELNMQYFAAPNVAGWPAFYSQPQFSEAWVNSVTIRPRQFFTTRIPQNGFFRAGFAFKIDVLAFLETINSPSDPNNLIDEIVDILFPVDLSAAQKTYLKNILIPGLPDYEWTVEYSNYIADPADTDLADSIASMLKNLLEAMLNMPEYHLC